MGCEDERRTGREATVVTVGESESDSVSVKRRGEAGKGESAHGTRYGVRGGRWEVGDGIG